MLLQGYSGEGSLIHEFTGFYRAMTGNIQISNILDNLEEARLQLCNILNSLEGNPKAVYLRASIRQAIGVLKSAKKAILEVEEDLTERP